MALKLNFSPSFYVWLIRSTKVETWTVSNAKVLTKASKLKAVEGMFHRFESIKDHFPAVIYLCKEGFQAENC